jgi:hypothetical protein
VRDLLGEVFLNVGDLSSLRSSDDKGTEEGTEGEEE